MHFFALEQTGKATIARIGVQRLTADVAHPAFAEVLQAVSDARALVVDLSELDFMDSTAIGELVAFGRKLRARKVACVITGLKPPLMNLIRMMRLEKIMDFGENVDADLEKLVQNLSRATPGS